MLAVWCAGAGAVLVMFCAVLGALGAVEPPRPVCPGDRWDVRTPGEVGLDPFKLRDLAELVGGRGCVVRYGYLCSAWGDVTRSADVASAMKPVISTLLLLAVQEGRLTSVDALVADYEPALKGLNGGKDARITWRHLASMTSGYGLAEAPGEAWAYNDYAIALYYDVLMQKVFRQNGTEVLRSRLGRVLGFEDDYSFEAFGPDDRAGRLAISVRDFARFGLLWARGGRWRGQQVLSPGLVRIALNSPVPASTPRTSGREADMLDGQRTVGGGKDQTPTGPGFYSFNWWLNRTDGQGRRLFVGGPSDLFVASGHGGVRAVWVLPSLDMVVSWNDASVEDHDASPGNPNTKCSRAVRLMVEAAR